MKRQSVLNQQSIAKKKKPQNGFTGFQKSCRIFKIIFECCILLILIFGLSISLMYGYHCLHTTSFVSLDQIEVEGVDDKVKQELIDMCGLESDVTLFSISLSDLKQKMERHPWVKSVQLSTRFPHTLFVKVEKQRVLALVIRNGVYYMNQDCELFKEVGESDEVDFPVITGISEEDSIARRQLARATRVMKTVARHKSPWSLKELSEMHVGTDEISLYYSNFPVEIRATADDLAKKISGLRKVTEHLRKAGQIHRVTGINLNYIGGAAVSFRKG